MKENNSGLKVTVHQEGGVLGIDRTVSVDHTSWIFTDRDVFLTDPPTVTETSKDYPTTPEHYNAVFRLAEKVLGLRTDGVDDQFTIYNGPSPSDSMIQTVTIKQGEDEYYSLTLRTLDSAPVEVFNLITAVTRGHNPNPIPRVIYER